MCELNEILARAADTVRARREGHEIELVLPSDLYFLAPLLDQCFLVLLSDQLLQSLVRQGYLSDYDMNRQEYRVLSAINYILEFADRIEIQNEGIEKEESNAKA